MAQALLGRTINVPIRGTLNRPQVDLKALAAANTGPVLDVFEELLKNRSAGGVLDRLQDRGASLLDRLRDARQRRAEGRKANDQ